MKNSDKIVVGISVGDLNGIGLEVVLKTFEDSRVLELCTPVIFASSKVVSFHKKALNNNTPIHGIDEIESLVPNKLNLLNVWKENVEIELGKPTKLSGSYAFKSLDSAIKALKNGQIDVLVTAPINKDNIQSEEFKFSGHTEYLESKLEGKGLMILIAENLRVGLITGHIPIADVAHNITQELIAEKTNLMLNSLLADFGIRKPKIAVLGLNPHCGDSGVIGKEDDEIVKPAIKKLQDEGKLIFGPYAADSFFGSHTYEQFDGILAMYHDQGLAPFKTLSFGKGVNFTAGLSKVRTSPDHGTAYEIAGKNTANHNSFLEAVYMALDIFENRNQYNELVENRLKEKIRDKSSKKRDN